MLVIVIVRSVRTVATQLSKTTTAGRPVAARILMVFSIASAPRVEQDRTPLTLHLQRELGEPATTPMLTGSYVPTMKHWWR